jgi:hypothetical protein
MLHSYITEDRYLVSDASNIRFQAFAYVENGFLQITLRTKLENGTRSKVLHGAAQFQSILQHFAGRFHAIRGNWVYGDNLQSFNAGVAAGLSLEESALQTWTGRQAVTAGFGKVEIVEVYESAGSFTQAKVNFWPRTMEQ